MKILHALSLALLLVLVTSCSIEPWVKPYQRANLAHSIMSFERDPIADSYSHHVYQAREGARGAAGSGGGGCGCN